MFIERCASTDALRQEGNVYRKSYERAPTPSARRAMCFLMSGPDSLGMGLLTEAATFRLASINMGLLTEAATFRCVYKHCSLLTDGGRQRFPLTQRT